MSVSVEGHVGVAGVVQHGEVMLLGELNDLLEVANVGDRAGGVVGVVEPDHLGAPSYVFGNRFEVGQPSASSLSGIQ